MGERERERKSKRERERERERILKNIKRAEKLKTRNGIPGLSKNRPK